MHFSLIIKNGRREVFSMIYIFLALIFIYISVIHNAHLNMQIYLSQNKIFYLFRVFNMFTR